ncbi:MAG: Putative hydrolase, partial [uncultured Blastococcus sp.]
GRSQLDPLPRRREPAADAGGAARLLGRRRGAVM